MATTERNMSGFERYLTVWVLLSIGAGILLGNIAPVWQNTWMDWQYM